MRIFIIICMIFLSVSSNAQSEIEVIESAWTDQVSPGEVISLVGPISVEDPYLWLKVKCSESFLDKIVETGDIPVRFKWFLRRGLAFNRNRSLQPLCNIDFTNDQIVADCRNQIAQSGTFSIELWSKSFKPIRSGSIVVNLVYDNNDLVDGCDMADCKFEIEVE